MQRTQTLDTFEKSDSFLFDLLLFFYVFFSGFRHFCDLTNLKTYVVLYKVGHRKKSFIELLEKHKILFIVILQN